MHVFVSDFFGNPQKITNICLPPSPHELFPNYPFFSLSLHFHFVRAQKDNFLSNNEENTVSTTEKQKSPLLLLSGVRELLWLNLMTHPMRVVVVLSSFFLTPCVLQVLRVYSQEGRKEEGRKGRRRVDFATWERKTWKNSYANKEN